MIRQPLALAAIQLICSSAAALPYARHSSNASEGTGVAAFPPHHNLSAARAHTLEAIQRAMDDEKVRMLHGSGFIPAVTMEYWKYVQTRGPILIISAAAGESAPGSAASYINSFMSMGIEMTFLPIYGANCPELIHDAEILSAVRDAHSIFFSGGMPGMLQGCLYGIDGNLEQGKTVPDGESTLLLDLILSKQTVGGDSAGLMAQPSGAYLTGIFPHDGATLIGEAQVPTGNMGLRTPRDYFIAHSHFSERGQQGPQLVAQWQEDVRVGAGFDEGLAAYYFEESGDMLMVADPDDTELRGAWIFELVSGSPEGQEGYAHMLVSGERWNARTNTRIRNPAYSDCSGTGTLPEPSDRVFAFSNNPIRRLALQVATAPTGSSLRNTDTGPAGHFVELIMTVTENTIAFCDNNGAVVGFEYLYFRQGRLSRRAPRPQPVVFDKW